MWLTPGAGNVERAHEPEGVRVAEVQAMQPFGDHDRVAPVDREVEVVRVVDRKRRVPAGR